MEWCPSDRSNDSDKGEGAEIHKGSSLGIGTAIVSDHSEWPFAKATPTR